MPPRCGAHRHLSAKPSGRTVGDVSQHSTDQLRAGRASFISRATGIEWPRAASAVWTLRCATACSGRPVQLEGYCVGPKPTSLRRRNVQGGEAAAVRALRGSEPSCAAAPRAETSGTVGLRPEEVACGTERSERGEAVRCFFLRPGPKPTSLRRKKERGASRSGVPRSSVTVGLCAKLRSLRRKTERGGEESQLRGRCR